MKLTDTQLQFLAADVAECARAVENKEGAYISYGARRETGILLMNLNGYHYDISNKKFYKQKDNVRTYLT